MEEQKDMQDQGQASSETSQAQETPQAQVDPQPVASEQPQAAPGQEQNTPPQATQENNTAGTPADTGKLWAIIGYIFPVLFFIPLVMDDLKTKPYSKFHANQQLVLLIAAIAVNVIGTIIPILGWFIILPIGSIILIILAIIGIINAAKDEQKPLPMIGGFTIIK